MSVTALHPAHKRPTPAELTELTSILEQHRRARRDQIDALEGSYAADAARFAHRHALATARAAASELDAALAALTDIDR